MLALSALLVFGIALLIVPPLTGNGPALWVSPLIHAPWQVLAPLWIGGALGVAALVRRFSLPRLAVVVAELPLIAAGSFYFGLSGAVPVSPLKVRVGEAFPAYALADQDGALHRLDAGQPREPALYIFYRGDW